jgi:hypothetical protein
MIKILLLCAVTGLALSETYRYVTEIRYEDVEHSEPMPDEHDDTWVAENEVVIKHQKPSQPARGHARGFNRGQKDHDHDHPSKQGSDVFSDAFRSLGGDVAHVSTRGQEVWAVKKDQSIHRFHDGMWQQIPGAAVNVGASPDGWTWVVNAQDEIFRYNPNNRKWERMPGSLVQVSAASKDSAIGVNRQKNVYLWRNGAWEALPRGNFKGLGNGAIWASVGKDDDRWAIGPLKGLWRWDNQKGKWMKQPGSADTIDVHSGGRIVVTNAANNAYTWTDNKRWQQVAGKVAKRASVGDNALLTVDADGVLSAVAF